MGCSSSLRGIREQGCAAWKQSPKRDHAHACHQWTYRSIPWATLSDGLWQAPVRLRPGFPDAPPYSVAGGDRVSGLIGRTGRVPRYLLIASIDVLFPEGHSRRDLAQSLRPVAVHAVDVDRVSDALIRRLDGQPVQAAGLDASRAVDFDGLERVHTGLRPAGRRAVGDAPILGAAAVPGVVDRRKALLGLPVGQTSLVLADVIADDQVLRPPLRAADPGIEEHQVVRMDAERSRRPGDESEDAGHPPPVPTERAQGGERAPRPE